MYEESEERRDSASDRKEQRKELEARLEKLVGKTTSGFELESDGEILVIKFESGEKLTIPLSHNNVDEPQHWLVAVE